MRKVTIDLDDPNFCETETQIRRGKCNRCGKCEIERPNGICEFLFIDSYLDHAQTKPIYSCKLQDKKPFWCVLGPLPDEPFHKGCGFYWENK